jgi:HipA-like protein
MKRPISARSSSDAGGLQRIGGVTSPSWQPVLRTVTATRYVTPLREGGSLPAIVEADDDGLYVCKFRGAGQGPKALAAEIVAGELARGLGLPVPELVLVELDPALAAAEPDPEIQELIVASAGLNLGVDFLPGALPYTPTEPPEPELAADVVWFDALVTNVDRTPRNPNLLRWHRNLWLIDHGAALYAFHGDEPLARARGGFAMISQHVLLPAAASIAEADARLAHRADPAAAAALVPEAWADGAPYAEFLTQRLQSPRAFAEEAERARA